jgi:hypothetical protein
MDLKVIEEFLVQNGIDPRELEETKEPKALSDLGATLMVTLQNDNQLGELVMSFFMQFNDIALLVMQQQTRIETLEAEVTALKGGN